MKILFKFEETQNVEKDLQTEEVDANGTKTIRIEKANIPVTRKFCLTRPNRALREDADLYTRAEYGKAVKAGMIPMALLAKRFTNDDGTLSESQKQEYSTTYEVLLDREREYQKLHATEEKDRTDEDKVKITDLQKEIRELNEKLQFLSKSQNGLYDNTPEMWARNKAMAYYTLFLSYEDKDGKLIPFFGDGDHKAKLNRFDAFEEMDDEFVNRVIGRFMFSTAIYYAGLASKQEEFEKVEKENT
jgi:hypothetical protein